MIFSQVMVKPSLYILDDDEQYANLLAEFASGSGWNAIAEYDPVAFLDKDISDAHVLVLDLVMPELDGIEIIRAIAEKKCEIILILVSGFDARVLHSAQQLAEAHNIKVAASLTKPIPVNEFMKVLASIETDEPAKNVNIEKETLAAEKLAHAIKNDELALYFQPQVNIQTGELVGVETKEIYDILH